MSAVEPTSAVETLTTCGFRLRRERSVERAAETHLTNDSADRLSYEVVTRSFTIVGWQANLLAWCCWLKTERQPKSPIANNQQLPSALMPLIRLVLLLGLAGGLFLLVQFNWSPLQLTFLGLQTPALPLALWILNAIAAGIVTNLLITSLFSLSNYFAVRAARSQFRQAPRRGGSQAPTTSSSEPSPSFVRSSTARTADDDDWDNWEGYEESATRPSNSVRSPVNQDPIDDWESESSDDWETDDPINTSADSRSATSRTRTEYEAKQEPKTTSRNGSVYSYSYREPQDFSIGTESIADKPVVDADYRVIVPPLRSLDEEPTSEAPTSAESADDWFEEDDDRVEDDSTRDRFRP